jgi:hypothetical protein
MSAVAVLTPEQLEAIVRKAVREELAALEQDDATAKTLTEEDLAKARKSLRRFGRGR